MCDNVLILAAGQQWRFGGNTLKQLLPLGDTTIIERTIRQCKARECNSVVVTVHHEIKEIDADFFIPLRYGVTSETLLSTYKLWENQVYVLLGDVIYSNNVLDKILGYTGKFRAFGNEWEIFGLSFQNNSHIVTALQATITQDGKGTLRNFCNNYFEVSGMIHEHPRFEKICHLRDYTNDIDTLNEYKSFLRKHLVTMQHDDNNIR